MKKALNAGITGQDGAKYDLVFGKDCTEAIVLAAEQYHEGEPVNIGTGEEVPIKVLTETVAELTSFSGKIAWDTPRPNGQPRRCLDTSRAQHACGFKAQTSLREGDSSNRRVVPAGGRGNNTQRWWRVM